jgi:vitamin B12 transporter
LFLLPGLKKLKTIVFGVCLVLGYVACAQSAKDSVRMLQEVVVEQSRLGDYAASRYTLRADSLVRSQASSGSLADMLRKFGFGHVRSYGPGGAASFASFRGTGSSHTAILWNGINLVSPLSGIADLSLVPVTFIDDISIKTGGVASLFGNGSIGGTIRLNNKASFNEGLTIRTFSNVGSFGNYFQDVGIISSGKQFVSSTKFFMTKAENNFPYTNNYVFPARAEERSHNAFNQYGFLQQNYLQLSPSHLLSAKLWYQDNRYEVPNPTSAGNASSQMQYEQFYRAIAGSNYNQKSFEINYQGAFVHHTLDYRNPAINETSVNIFNNLIQSVEANFLFNSGAKLTSGVTYNWEQAKVDQFGGQEPIRNRIAFFTALKWRLLQRLEMDASVREEVVNGNTTPIAPAVTMTGTVSKKLKLYVNASRNYRLPALNDLYWRSGGTFGNPQLKPELSLGEEVGLLLESSEAEATQYSFKFVGFNTMVDDWIFWNPASAATYVPVNIKKVWSRGIETQGSVGKTVRTVRLEVMFQYSYNLATNESIYEGGNPNELNKQLMFTPAHEASATLRSTWRGFSLNIVGNYTGKQYTDSDNTESSALKGYTVTNLWLARPFNIKKAKTTVNGEVNNLFGTEYQARPGYPMPGRNFKLGLTIQLNKPYKS